MNKNMHRNVRSRVHDADITINETEIDIESGATVSVATLFTEIETLSQVQAADKVLSVCIVKVFFNQYV